jgi:hypothetical protein
MQCHNDKCKNTMTKVEDVYADGKCIDCARTCSDCNESFRPGVNCWCWRSV